LALWYETFHFDSHPVHRLEGAVHQTVIPRVVFQYLEGFSMKRTSSVQLRLSLQSEVGGALIKQPQGRSPNPQVIHNPSLLLYPSCLIKAPPTSDCKLSLNCTEEVRFIENPSRYWNTTLGITV
jgi:hypothetical protein